MYVGTISNKERSFDIARLFSLRLRWFLKKFNKIPSAAGSILNVNSVVAALYGGVWLWVLWLTFRSHTSLFISPTRDTDRMNTSSTDTLFILLTNASSIVISHQVYLVCVVLSRSETTPATKIV
jgi:hypothetical protein